MRLPDAGTAGKILMGLLALLMVMHVLLLMRLIPYEVVWGGNIKDESHLNFFEISALLITGIFLVIVAIKLGYIKAPRLNRVANIGVWIVFAYFSMNIIGNLTSETSWEKLIFIPLSAILAALALRVATQNEE